MGAFMVSTRLCRHKVCKCYSKLPMQKLNYCIRAKYENHLSILFYEKAMHTHEAKLPLQVPMVDTNSYCNWPEANTQIKLNECIFCKKRDLESMALSTLFIT